MTEYVQFVQTSDRNPDTVLRANRAIGTRSFRFLILKLPSAKVKRIGFSECWIIGSHFRLT